MKSYQRPWWVLALKMPALNTTLKEDHRSDEKRFLIEGEPVLKSLTWVTYGPGLALMAVIISGVLAWGLEVRTQPTLNRALAGCSMILLPLLFWVVGSGIINRLMQGALNEEIQAGREKVELVLNLSAKTFQMNQDPPILFGDISDFKLISDAGVYYDPQEEIHLLVNLIMETKRGQVTLLKKELGTIRQKVQLLSQLRALVEGKHEGHEGHER